VRLRASQTQCGARGRATSPPNGFFGHVPERGGSVRVVTTAGACSSEAMSAASSMVASSAASPTTLVDSEFRSQRTAPLIEQSIRLAFEMQRNAKVAMQDGWVARPSRKEGCGSSDACPDRDGAVAFNFRGNK